MSFNLITNIIIGICIIIILIFYFYVNSKPNTITVDPEIEFEYVSCKYNDDGVTKIRDECIIECEEQGSYEVVSSFLREIEEGETLHSRTEINESGEETFYYYLPNIVYEYHEEVTTHTFPPCNRFCTDCTVLVEKN